MSPFHVMFSYRKQALRKAQKQVAEASTSREQSLVDILKAGTHGRVQNFLPFTTDTRGAHQHDESGENLPQAKRPCYGEEDKDKRRSKHSKCLTPLIILSHYHRADKENYLGQTLLGQKKIHIVMYSTTSNVLLFVKPVVTWIWKGCRPASETIFSLATRQAYNSTIPPNSHTLFWYCDYKILVHHV